ncbi:MAG: thioredoxin domain-containing protein, partial [Pseudomonadota bacterium]
MPHSKDAQRANSAMITTASNPNRRQLMLGSAALTLAGFAGLTVGARQAAAQSVPVAELSRSGGLADIVLGPDDAAVTIIEYASLSCGHCKRFHETVYPELKKKYVDTGKARFIYRDFPLDNRAAAAAMLSRCIGDDKTYSMISVLFEQQEDWAYVRGDP